VQKAVQAQRRRARPGRYFFQTWHFNILDLH
jgi:hypothetical protein